MLTREQFMEKLNSESKKMIEEIWESYPAFKNVYDDLYAAYEEGWESSDKDDEAENYYADPNNYVRDWYNDKVDQLAEENLQKVEEEYKRCVEEA